MCLGTPNLCKFSRALGNAASLEAVEKAIKNPELKAKIEKMQFVVHYQSPTELRKLAAEEYEKALAIANKIGLRKMN